METKKFEYLTKFSFRGLEDSELNALGSKGWELVSILSIDSSCARMMYTFKKEKPE